MEWDEQKNSTYLTSSEIVNHNREQATHNFTFLQSTNLAVGYACNFDLVLEVQNTGSAASILMWHLSQT
jgi:hypothetical protein